MMMMKNMKNNPTAAAVQIGMTMKAANKPYGGVCGSAPPVLAATKTTMLSSMNCRVAAEPGNAKPVMHNPK
jgi:hypothetical protein